MTAGEYLLFLTLPAALTILVVLDILFGHHLDETGEDQ